MELDWFDANSVDPAKAFEPLPAGWYKVVIVSSEDRVTRDMQGSFLKLELEVIEGDHAGRKVFENLNLNNSNETAVEMAQRSLSGICRAVGVMTPKRSEDLHDKPMMVKLKVQPPKDGYGASNSAVEFAAPEAGQSAPPARDADTTSKPPWKR